MTINEIHNVYAVPKSLQQQWAACSQHGDVQHNSGAVINRFLGFCDGNPVNLTPLSPRDSAPLFVEMMGVTTFDDLLRAGKARFEGDRKPFDQLRSLMVPFTPSFEILPGTSAKATARALQAFAVRRWQWRLRGIDRPSTG